VVGFSGWLDSFLRQVENHELMQGTLSDTGLGLVCLVFCLLFIQWNWRRSRQRAADQSKSQTDRSTWNAILSGVLAAVPLLGAWVLGVSPVLGILSSAGILLQLFLTGNGSGQEQGGSENPHGEVGSKSLGRSLAAWLLAAWFCGLLLATPLYYPYPRLTIPWTISAWLGTAAFAGWVEQRCAGSLFRNETVNGELESRPLRILPGISVVLFVLVLVVCCKPWRVAAWEPRNGLAVISERVISDIIAASRTAEMDRSNFILYIYAEPGLLFNVKAHGHQATGPVADFQFLNALPPHVPVYLMVGPHAATDADFQKKFNQVRDRFDLLKTYDYAPSLLVRLNQANLGEGSETEPVLLYRAK